MQDKSLSLKRKRLESTQAQEVVDSTTENQAGSSNRQRGRPRNLIPKQKKTITLQRQTQFVLDALRTAALRKHGKKPSEGEIIERALDLMVEAEGVRVD